MTLYEKMDVQECMPIIVHIYAYYTLTVHFTTVALQGGVKVTSMTNQRNSE